MRKNYVLTIAAAVLLLTAACSGPTGDGDNADDTVTIGFAVPVLANPYWSQNVDFAKAAAAELGAEIVVADAKSSESTQLTNVQNLISQGVDGIIFGPVTVAVGPAILDACKVAKIQCAAVARKPGVEADASNADYYVGYVVGNDYGDGEAAAQALSEAGATKCVVMSGQQGNSVADDRLQGFVDYAADNGLEILSTFRPAEVASEGQQATENFLAQFPGPGFDCLYVFDGDAGTGALSALANKGVIDKVKVANLDANPENQKAIKDGTLIASAAAGEFVNGGFATILVYDAINGHAPKSREVVLNGVVVNKDNVDAYSEQYSGTPTIYDIKNLSQTYNPDATTDDLVIVVK
jgi:ABC-type sugar transport system substrate-binding protein